MNKFKKILMFLLILTKQELYSMESTDWICGPQRYEKKNVEQIRVNGFVELDLTNVTKEILVNGYLRALNSTLGNIQVNGRAILVNSLVKGITNINGSLEAETTQFENTVFIASQVALLDGCLLPRLVIKPVDNNQGIQRINLNGNTQISGDVIVESGRGEIIIENGSEIFGIVNGASIIKK